MAEWCKVLPPQGILNVWEEDRNLCRPFDFSYCFIDYAQTLMLNISFKQKIANREPSLSYKAVFLDMVTPSPIHVLLRA